MIEIRRENLFIFVIAALVVGFVIGRSSTKRELAGLADEAKTIAIAQLTQGAGKQAGAATARSASPRVTAAQSATPVVASRPGPTTPPPPAAATTAEIRPPVAAPPATVSRPAVKPRTPSPAPVQRLEKIWGVEVHDDDAILGPKDAPVTLVLFSAFGCEPCMRFAPHLDKLMADPAYRDKVRVHFKHKIFDAPSPDAFIASRAAAAAQLQGKFWEMRKALVAARFAVGRDNLDQLAQQAGVNVARFRRDIDSDAVRAKVLRDSLGAYEVGAHSFPNILANGVRIKKPKDWSALKKLVDGQIARAAELTKLGLKGSALYAKAIEGGKTFPQLGDKVPAFVTAGAPTMGAKAGAIELVVFEDFECPFCAKSAPNLKQFVDRYPNDVTFVFKHFPLDIHANAPLAHEASLAAAAQGKFWQYHDKLFDNQQALSAQDLERYAGEIGLDVAKFKAALKAGKHKPTLQRDLRDGRRAQVTGTPSVFLNGKKYQGPRGYNPLGLEAVARRFLGLKPKR